MNNLRSGTAYRVIRIDFEYDKSVIDEEAAKSQAVETVIAEAKSNALYNGFLDDVKVNDVVDCGESV